MPVSGWEALPDVREWSGDPQLCPGVVGRPTGLSGMWSGGPHGSPGVVGRNSRMSGNGREVLLEVRE